MPWQQSMLGNHWSSAYNQTDVITCNSTNKMTLFELDYNYLTSAASFNIPDCIGKFSYTYEAVQNILVVFIPSV